MRPSIPTPVSMMSDRAVSRSKTIRAPIRFLAKYWALLTMALSEDSASVVSLWDLPPNSFPRPIRSSARRSSGWKTMISATVHSVRTPFRI